MSLPIGYLIPALMVLLCVYFVTAPLAWPRPFRFWWVVTGVVNELPLIAALFLVANTALAIYEGDINSVGGWIAFGFNAAAFTGLMVLFYWSLQAAPTIRQAFREELGSDWSARLDSQIVQRLAQNFSLKALLGPFFIRSASVQHIRDVAYGPAGKYHSLDIYHSKSGLTHCPIFIHLHGGALRTGKKDNDARPVLYHLAQQGWLCLSANYRLQPDVSFNEQLDDIRQVVAWARAHGAEYGGDPDFIMLGGGSSGGHLAAMIGLESGFVKAVVALYGQFFYGPPEEAPITRVHQDAPPFLLLHGDHDNLVPVVGTRQLAQKLRDVSKNPVVYAELPHAEHNLDQFNSVRSLAAARAVEAFGAWVRSTG
ncbi:MAG: alpha/beta hydrolase [Ardenticatenaceae bacterium]|nr:alpha/beta hydrolase [Ardenticatenaceae bacterium]